MNFAFLVHSRDYTDVQLKFKIAGYLPKSWVEWWCLHWPPILLSEITGLKSQKIGKEIKGWLIGIPMTAKQIMENKSLAKKRVIQAINKAEKLGAKIVGLGALTSSVTNGGLDLLRQTNLKITTGNTLTAGISFMHVNEILKNNNQIIKVIGIIGATGSIGQALARLCVQTFPEKEFQLFARNKENLEALKNNLKSFSASTKISFFQNDLTSLKEADMVIVATSSPDAFIKSDNLKKGAIIYDITQPQNISVNEIKNRPDLKIYDGGLVVVNQFNKKLPLGLEKNTVFACLAETILLALEDKDTDGLVGKVKFDMIKEMMRLAQKYHFTPVKLKYRN